ncbi:hypothetical protein [Spiroplasma endosymbiont of Monopis laevigella]
MPIITTKCYISSCEKEYTFDSLYCSGKCYQQAFNNTVTKYTQK